MKVQTNIKAGRRGEVELRGRAELVHKSGRR